MRSGRDVRGFTLIELLVALAIFAMMAVSLGAAFHNGLGAWKKGQKSAELNQQARAVFEQMARELRNAVALPKGIMKMEDGTFSFYSVRDPAIQGAEPRNVQEIVRLSYQLTPDGTSPRFLVRSQAGYSDDGDGKVLPLTTFPTEIEFEFAYAPDHAVGIRWKKIWQSPDVFPAAVRVRLTLHEDEGPLNAVTFTKTIPIPTGVLTAWKE